MNLRTEWMTDAKYFGDNYPNNALLDDAKVTFEKVKSGSDGRDAKVDGVEERIVAQNHTNPLNQAQYDKKLLLDMTSNVHMGSMVEFDDKHWLVVRKIYDRHAYKLTSAVECVDTFTVYKNSTATTVYYHIENSIQLYRMGVDYGKYINVPEGQIVVRVQDNDTTALITRGEIYRIGRQNYKIIDIMDAIQPGILIFKMEWTAESPEPIPSPTPVQPVLISGSEEIIYGKSATYSTDEDVIFTLTGDFATITEQTARTCTIKAGKSYGEVTLKAVNSEDEEGTKTILICDIW